MNQRRFIAFTRTLSSMPSRRDVLRGFAAAGLGPRIAWRQEAAAARKKRKHTRKPKPNEFGCLNVGKICKREDQCCSGICTGKKGKKRCKAHDTGGCRAGDTPIGCGGTQDVPCTTSLGNPGFCRTTIGNAGYCGASGGMCQDCAKDAECQAIFGPGSACVLCPGDCADFGGRACF